jgi:hypothetical protein
MPAPLVPGNPAAVPELPLTARKDPDQATGLSPAASTGRPRSARPTYCNRPNLTSRTKWHARGGASLPDSDLAGSPKDCFVAMPITTPERYAETLRDPDHFLHVLEHLFTPALQGAGLTVIPPTATGTVMIQAEIIRNLQQADFVLCDLSSLNPNVFFELGIRTSLDLPVILVKDNLTEQIPFDLNAVNTLTYESSLTPWTLGSQIQRLTEHVKRAIGGGSSGNSMWRYFGLTRHPI